ncbi:hypothetical protein DdX_14050 [Ditylenchus destructor]|uniref:Uncharacterized protein n=1 Tax=Ditylenchus destructor TaxID=166010 RepID=A0AAD4QYX7_9BILA|nr:hypothetical protein DdX_14050 [Ditylenchus destructor]
MEKIRSWFVRQRDRTFASYSRFGRPGEEEDDRPPPTQILVAPFDENAPEFMFFRAWHVQKAAITFACFGMSMVVLIFISSFFEFDWYHHQKGVDVGALLGLFFYLALGVLIHYYVLYGIKKQNPFYLLPFIVAYSIVCTGELFLFLALLFRVTDTQSTTMTQIHPSQVSMLLIVSLTVAIQATMLQAILKCRQFLSLKQIHEMEMRVAEKSRTENPAIQIVVAKDSTDASNSESPTGENGATNGHVV